MATNAQTAQNLASVISQANKAGIDTTKAQSMLNQNTAQGSKPYAGSSFDTSTSASKVTTPTANSTPAPTPTPTPIINANPARRSSRRVY